MSERFVYTYSNSSSAVILTGNRTVFLSIGIHLQRRSHPNHALCRVEGKIYRTCAVTVAKFGILEASLLPQSYNMSKSLVFELLLFYVTIPRNSFTEYKVNFFDINSRFEFWNNRLLSTPGYLILWELMLNFRYFLHRNTVYKLVRKITTTKFKIGLIPEQRYINTNFRTGI